MMEEKTFNARDVALNYVECGAPGGAPLLMLHGGAWCWQEYLPLMPALSLRHRVLGMDLRGHGKSTHTPGHYRLQDFVEDVVAFLEARGGEPTVLLGHSVGSVVAILVGTHRPDLVRALILEEPVLTLDAYRRVVEENAPVYHIWSSLAGQSRSALELSRRLAEAPLPAQDPSFADSKLSRHEGSGPSRFGDLPGVTPDQLLFLGLCLRGLDPTFLPFLLQHYDRFIEGFDPQVLLPALRPPTLILHGESHLGGVITPTELDEGRRILPPHAVLVGYQGLGHDLHMSSCEPIVRTVSWFLEAL